MALPPALRLRLGRVEAGVMLSPRGAPLETLPVQRPSRPLWASAWRASRIPLTEAMKGG